MVGNLCGIFILFQIYYLKLIWFIYYMIILLEIKTSCLSLLISQPANGYSLISIVPYSGCSEMFIFLTSTTTAAYWFRETAFQLKELQEGTERLRGASVGCYHLHGMNSLIRNRKVIRSKPAALLRRNPTQLIVHSCWFLNIFFSSRDSGSSLT